MELDSNLEPERNPAALNLFPFGSGLTHLFPMVITVSYFNCYYFW